MRVPWSWLKEWVPELPEPWSLEELLAKLGVETGSIERLAAPPSGVVFARVQQVREIPGTSLKVALLEAHDEVQVVSGAPNLRTGIGVALALPGTELNDQTMSVRTIQGVRSYGMALSPRELAVGDYGGGLLEFPPEALSPGTPLAEVWPEEIVLDLEITPNRGDLLSILGLARELAAVGLAVRFPKPAPQRTSIPLRFRAAIEDPGCSRLSLFYAEGWQPGPSPLIPQRRLMAAGMRAISLVVDATNYTMLEWGNPLHAYDAAQVGGGLVARSARPGERLVTLDGVERQLDPEDLVIAQPEGLPLGLAGVMGGGTSEVNASTQALVLEVASFDPVRIRRTAKRHNLKTEASYRFERGVDLEATLEAGWRCLELIQRWGGGVVAEAVADQGGPPPRKVLSFNPERSRKLIGLEISDDEQLRALEGLGFKLHEGGELRVEVPSYRHDILLEEDLIEEVARLVGYDRIPLRLSSFFPAPDNLGVEAAYLHEEELKQVVSSLGFQEVINYAWTSLESLRLLKAPEPPFALRNPLAQGAGHLRTALYPGLLANLRYNLDQAEPGPFLLFELGSVFLPEGERRHLALLLAGAWVEGRWQPGISGGFYALKGLLEATAERLGASLKVEVGAVPALHPGVSGRLIWEGEPVGFLGQLHPELMEALELPPVYLAELSLPLAKPARPFQDLPKFPPVLRDLAIVLPEEVPYGELEALLKQEAGPYLESLELFDLYRGAPLPPGQKSLAFHLRFRHPERTLRDEEVEAVFTHLEECLAARGYSLRKA